MADKHNYILKKGYSVNDEYTVTFPQKKGSYAEAYRVKSKQGKTYFLKLFSYSKLHRTQFDSNENILEIELLKQVKHPNIVKFKDSGDLVIENQKYAFVILDFISGETVADKMKRDKALNPYDAKNLILGVLNGLNYLHNLKNPIIHNDITNLNVMMDLSGKIAIPKIIDFGYSRYFRQSNKDFMKDGLNPFYMANETFNKVFSAQSDVFAVGALYYHLLFGMPPWFVEVSSYKSDKVNLEELVLEQRKKPLKVLNSDTKIDDNTMLIIKKALETNTDHRFKTVKEFIKAINGELVIENHTSITTHKPKQTKPKKGKGFSAIAGMSELKEKMKEEVIDVIEDPEEFRNHGVSIPNGLLLYGPPGCGKTFFAEQFAEEAGYNFIKVVSSDIASIYIHGSQEKIGELFKTAREQAPTILYFDELDAMVPNREKLDNQSQSGEVNEFLSQLDNIGDSGVFVIGSTNKPESIDLAILRAGRLEKSFCISQPDFEARKAMFKLYLKKRPTELGLDYKKLAEITENYVSSDIKLIVDNASRKAITDKKKGLSETSKISMNTLLGIIKSQKPSVSLSELKKYEVIKAGMEGQTIKKEQRTRVGF